MCEEFLATRIADLGQCKKLVVNELVVEVICGCTRHCGSEPNKHHSTFIILSGYLILYGCWCRRRRAAAQAPGAAASTPAPANAHDKYVQLEDPDLATPDLEANNQGLATSTNCWAGGPPSIGEQLC